SHSDISSCWADDDPRPLIVHVMFRFDTGGLESVILKLINDLPENAYRHAIISLTTASDFHHRITRSDVPVFTLAKQPGKDLKSYVRYWKLLRQLHPDLVHTCNIATMDTVVASYCAGITPCIHAEHGRDIYDLRGENRKYILLRRLLAPFFTRIIAVSGELEQWLLKRVKLSRGKVQLIYNGVNLELFSAQAEQRQAHLPAGFADPDTVIIGTVGRLAPVKNQALVIDAVAHMVKQTPESAHKIRLVLVGDGELADALQHQVRRLEMEPYVWFAGNRDDVQVLMRCMDVFVLASLAEGIALTVLEAMASGLPLVLTQVGGNPELVRDNENGFLIPSESPESLAGALQRYIEDPALRRRHGRAGRLRVEKQFNVRTMVEQYQRLFAEVLE
ncbi:MAG: TIGR03088 family PEP-CTERM/XrtA system glycosyltransferase, partial [Mariprofundaceae bacterium]|nr:TIGR03088 family PEP-CTERM/XrtA system glycosyltransferase [Mariprofundaceae bacterium]